MNHNEDGAFSYRIEWKAWGNMGAVHMHEGNWAGAAAAFTQGLKQMPSNWRMWENQAEAMLRLQR